MRPVPMERVETIWGETFDLYSPRVVQFGEGRVLRGIEFLESGQENVTVVPFDIVAKRTALTMSPQGDLIEAPDLPLPSDW